SLIRMCRTGELGHLRYDCDDCRRTHWVGRSCGNRHCPNCQAEKTQKWLAERLSELLPVPYFLVTFTVPEALRKIVRAHQGVCYRALFDGGSQTIRQLASGNRFIGTDRMGFFGALHTWGRDFTVYNPHVHFVVPGGGVSEDGSKWQACPPNFLLVEKAASIVFRAKFRDAVRAADIEDEFLAADPKAWTRQWTMDVEPVGDGRGTLKYLAPYVYRVAISNNRIESMDETHVVYRYTPSGTNLTMRRRVTGQEFVRGFLQHTLPAGFHRIRYYGFLNKHSSLSIDRVRMLVWFYLGWCYVLAKSSVPEPPPKRPMRCTECGGTLHLVEITDHVGRVLYSHPLPYLDSG
ncbi:MAG: transposase, partial [Fuerstiella sp.]